MDEKKTTLHRRRNIHDYVRMLIKRRWALLAVFVIVAGTVAFHTFTEVPIYQATVQLLIDRPSPRVFEQGAPQYDYYAGDEYFQTQYKLLESRALAKKLVDKLQLKNHPNFKGIFESLPPNADELQRQRAEEALVGAIAGGVSVNPVRQSTLVNLSFSDPDPKFATYIVNALAQCYIEQSLDLRFASSQEVSLWLKEKLVEARQKLEESENKLNQYKKAQNIVTLEDKETITSTKLEQLNKDYLASQTHRMEVETRFNEVNEGRPISQVLNSPLVSTLRTQEAKLIAEQSELSRKFGPEHPRFLQLNNELSAIRGKISAETHTVIQTIKNEYRMAKAQEENLKQALNATKADTQDLSDRGIQYRVLLRDVETNRALYENVLKTLKTTTVNENIPSTNIRIVYPATVPGAPISPRTSRNLFMGVIMGLGLGVMVALGLETLDTTLKTPEEMEKWLAIPNLAMIPHLKFSGGQASEDMPELFVHHGNEPLAAEACRGLRTSILFSAPGHAPRVLLVTSSMPAEGKTMTAANLATVMAQTEAKVLLVDSDLRRPTVHQLFHVEKEPGLSNFLVGEIDNLPFVETVVPNLFVVPSGKIPPNPSELLGSERMGEFLARAQEEFGRVILDSPPLVSVTDAGILSTRVEGVLLLVKAEAVPRKVAIEARDQLQALKAHILGTIFNNVPVHRDGYYYNYYHRHRSYYHAKGDKDRPKPGYLGRLLGNSVDWVKTRLEKFI